MKSVLELQGRAGDADDATRGSNWSWWGCAERDSDSTVSIVCCAGNTC